MSKNFDIIHGNPSQCLFAMVLPMMAAMFLNMAYIWWTVYGLETCWESLPTRR